MDRVSHEEGQMLAVICSWVDTVNRRIGDKRPRKRRPV